MRERDEQFHVERRVIAPVARQRPVRPVGGGVLFRKRHAQIMLGHIGEAEAVKAQDARGDLGVEQRMGCERELGEAGKVLLRVVQDPCGVTDGAVEHAPVHTDRVQRHRVEQSDAGAVAFELMSQSSWP